MAFLAGLPQETYDIVKGELQDGALLCSSLKNLRILPDDIVCHMSLSFHRKSIIERAIIIGKVSV